MHLPGSRGVAFTMVIVCSCTVITASHQQHSPPVKHATPFPNGNTLHNRLPTLDRASRSSERATPVDALPPKPKPDKTISAPRVVTEPVPQSSSKVDTVVAFALAQQGKPYVFGTAGLRAYDCSGLVMRAFAQVGISLPHYTGGMLTYGRRISRAELQRGDIVFPSSSHVGIYLGAGRMIVAPHSGTSVQIQNVYSFYTARRLL